MMHLDASILRDRDRALATEWLLADGAGGYASSTVLMAATRRYHGLWVPALNPPVDRRVVLAHIEERLTTDSGQTFLSTRPFNCPVCGWKSDRWLMSDRPQSEPHLICPNEHLPRYLRVLH